MHDYKPRLCVVVYDGKHNEYGHAEYYLEAHHIDEQGRILEGKPLEQETIQGIVDVFFDENQNRQNIKGWFPGELLVFEHKPGGKYFMVWYRPEQQRFLHFAPALKIKSGLAWVPPMLYVTDSRSLKVFAMKSSKRPDAKTKFYHAPFHNVSESGDVCLGSGKVKKHDSSFTDVIRYWEEYFWNTEFSHLAGHRSPTDSNINSIWKAMIKDSTIKWSGLDELKLIKGLSTKNLK